MMKAEKYGKNGKWMIQYRYKDWTGKVCKSTKRGFNTKREAEEWLRNFLQVQKHDLDMKFSDFVSIYMDDMKGRLREHTMINKRYIIADKLLPYFGQKPMNEITVADIRAWQNMLMEKGYSQTYLKTINNQLSAIFNFAVRYYELSSNPCRKAGSMGKAKAEEKQFWIKEEFQEFIDSLMDKRVSWMAFMVLFWTGMRIGELLALTWEDIDFDARTLTINKSYQRLKGKDVVTAPKTPKANRKISLPDFLVADLQDYHDSLYKPDGSDRVLPISKSTLEKDMVTGCERSGVKKIRIHDIRHSHASLLAKMRVPIKEVSERLGHENIETTLNTYSHLYPDDQQLLAEQLNDFYQKGQQQDETEEADHE